MPSPALSKDFYPSEFPHTPFSFSSSNKHCIWKAQTAVSLRAGNAWGIKGFTFSMEAGGRNNPNCYPQKRELCSKAATAPGSFVQKNTSKSAAKSPNEVGSVRNCSCIYAYFSNNCLGGLPPSHLFAVRAVNWDIKCKDLSKCSGLGIPELPDTSHWPEAVWPSASET